MISELIFGLIAAIAWGVHDFLVRVIVRNLSISISLGLTYLISIFLLVSVVFTFGTALDLSSAVAIISVAYGILFFLAGFCLYKAFELGPVSVAAPIIASYPIFSLALAKLEGASVSNIQLGLCFFVFMGILITVRNTSDVLNGKVFSNYRTIGWAFSSSFLFACCFTLAQNEVNSGNELLSNLIARVSALLVLSVIFIKSITFFKISKLQFFVLIVMAGLDTLALLIMVYSSRLNSPEFSIVASSTFGLFTILLASIFLQEKLKVIQMFGIAIVFCSIGILSVSS